MADFPFIRFFSKSGQSSNWQVHGSALDENYYYLAWIKGQASATEGAVLARMNQDLSGTATYYKLTHGVNAVAIQGVHVAGDYLYMPAFRNAVGVYYPEIFKVQRSDLSIVGARQLGVGVNGQGVVVCPDGRGVTSVFANARVSATSNSYYIWKLIDSTFQSETDRAYWTLSRVRHIWGYLYDSSDNNRLYVICEAANATGTQSCACLVKITQGNDGTYATLSVQSALRLYNDDCGNEALSGATYLSALFDGDYIWAVGSWPCAGGDGYGDVIISKIRKTASGTGNLEHIGSWRIHRTTTTPFRGGLVAVDGSYLYLSTFSSPHSGLGSTEYNISGPGCVMRINKSTLESAPANALSWAKEFDYAGGGAYHSILQAIENDNYLILGASSNIHDSGGYWRASAALVDKSSGDLAATLYTGDGVSSLKNSTVTISALSGSGFTAEMFTPDLTGPTGSDAACTGYSWGADTDITDSSYTFNSEALVLTLRPNGAGDTPGALAIITGQGGTPHWDQINDSPTDDDTYIGWNSSDPGSYDTWYRELFALENYPTGHNIQSRIDKIRINIRVRNERATSAVWSRESLKVGGTEYEASSYYVLPGNDTWYSHYTDWTTNPNTGLAWTWDDINNLQAGVDLQSKRPGLYRGWPKSSELWVDVYYTPWKVTSLLGNGGTVIGGSAIWKRTLPISAAVAAQSSTGAPVLSNLMALTSTVAAQASTGTPVLSVARALSATIAADSTTSTPPLSVSRPLSATCAAVSNTSTPPLAVDRPLSATMAAASSTSTPSMTFAIAFSSAVPAVSVTGTPNLSIGHPLTAVCSAVSNTGTPILAVARPLSATAGAVSATSTPALIIASNAPLSASVQAVSNTAAVVLSVARPITSASEAQSNTGMPILSVVRALASTIAAASYTSDAVDLDVGSVCSMSATVDAQSTTSTPALSVVRPLAATCAAVSTTGTPALMAGIALSATIAAVSVTSEATLDIAGVCPFSATCAATSTTSTPGLSVARELGATSSAVCTTGTPILNAGIRLQAAVSAVSLTGAPNLYTGLLLAATVAAQSNTGEADLDVLIELAASIAGVSSTAEIALLIDRPLSATVGAVCVTDSVVLGIPTMGVLGWLANTSRTPRLKAERL